VTMFGHLAVSDPGKEAVKNPEKPGVFKFFCLIDRLFVSYLRVTIGAADRACVVSLK
jgi:hypothetical protein